MRFGFTLVELMISIAIALVLILGINQVFKIAAQTVGAGQAMSTINSDNRTAHFTIYNDVHNAVTQNTPAFNIFSTQQFAFRNVLDQNSDTDGNANTIDLPSGGTATLDPTAVNDRSHRIDLLSFFASGDLYARQTANDGQFVSPTTGNEAYIWYGHTLLPDNAAAGTSMSAIPAGTSPDWFIPGDTAANNSNNRFASDWILGRMAMLLVPTPPTGDDTITATSPANPLGFDAVSTNNSGGGVWNILQSRYDIVNTSITNFRTGNSAATITVRAPAMATAKNRIWANPFVHKPLDAKGMAGAAPLFLRHCSQFIVEYAGDYLTQDNNPYLNNNPQTPNPDYGKVLVTAGQPITGDGVVDFIVDKSPSATDASKWIRKTRWYGFPRDSNGDGAVDVRNDVVPLYHVKYQAAADNGQTTTPASFEFTLPINPNWTYGTPPPTPPANYVGNMPSPNPTYTCSWGADTTEPLPQMIRITIALDDPNGRLSSPQYFEYVIDLQH